MAEKVDQEIERIAQEAEYEARQMIPTARRVITSHDVAVIAARLGRQQGLREAAEVAADTQKNLYASAIINYNQGCRDAAAAITALMEGEGK